MERKLAGIAVAVMFFGGQAWMVMHSDPQLIAPKTTNQTGPGDPPNIEVVQPGKHPGMPKPTKPMPSTGKPDKVAKEHKEVRPFPLPCPPCASHIHKEV